MLILPDAIANSRDKLRSLQILAEAGINMPITGFASHTKDIEGVIESVGSTPLIMKLIARHTRTRNSSS